MFLQRHNLRRWALRVLMVWVFGVGLGVANACLASFEGVRGAMSAVTNSSSAADDVMPEGCEHRSDAAREQGDSQTRHEKSNCESFCERASVPAAPQKSMIDDLHGDLLPHSVVTSIAPAPAPAPSRLPVPPPDGPRSLPIPIAFLRLAL
jgi:hypothetical protein